MKSVGMAFLVEGICFSDWNEWGESKSALRLDFRLSTKKFLCRMAVCFDCNLTKNHKIYLGNGKSEKMGKIVFRYRKSSPTKRQKNGSFWTIRLKVTSSLKYEFYPKARSIYATEFFYDAHVRLESYRNKCALHNKREAILLAASFSLVLMSMVIPSRGPRFVVIPSALPTSFLAVR